MKKYDKKRDAIKEAGIKSFSAYGYNKTTLEDIAGMLGLKKNSLYYYYDSKEALFRELVEDEIQNHIEFLEKLKDQKLPSDEKLMKLIEGITEFIQERTLKYTVKLSAYLEISKVIKNEFENFSKKECSYIKNILDEGIDSGIFIKHNSKQLAADIEYLVPAMFRSYYTEANAEFVHEVDFKVISKRIIRLVKYIINGIKIK